MAQLLRQSKAIADRLLEIAFLDPDVEAIWGDEERLSPATAWTMVYSAEQSLVPALKTPRPRTTTMSAQSSSLTQRGFFPTAAAGAGLLPPHDWGAREGI